jgi:hypothetical protein
MLQTTTTTSTMPLKVKSILKKDKKKTLKKHVRFEDDKLNSIIASFLQDFENNIIFDIINNNNVETSKDEKPIIGK